MTRKQRTPSRAEARAGLVSAKPFIERSHPNYNFSDMCETDKKIDTLRHRAQILKKKPYEDVLADELTNLRRYLRRVLTLGQGVHPYKFIPEFSILTKNIEVQK